MAKLKNNTVVQRLIVSHTFYIYWFRDRKPLNLDLDEGVSLFQNEISVIKLFGSQQASFCTDLYYFACVARVMHHTSIPSSYHNCSLFYLNSPTSHPCSHHFPHAYKQTKVTQLHQLQCLVSVCQKRLSPSICSDGQFAIFYSFSLRISQISQMSCSSLFLILFILFCCPPPPPPPL